MKNKAKNFTSAKRETGAVMLEAAIVLPVVILIIFGALDLFSIHYNRYVARAALQEGILIAQSSDALHRNVWTLPAPTGSGVTSNETQRFVEARARLARLVGSILRKSLYSGAEINQVEHLDQFSNSRSLSEKLPVGYLPPASLGFVSEWGNKLVKNDYYCPNQNIGSHAFGQNAQNVRIFTICRGTNDNDLTALSTENATEVKAFLTIPTTLFGRFNTTVAAAGFVAGTGIPHGMVVFDYDRSISNTGVEVSGIDGAYTWTVPAGVTSVTVEAWGAGARGLTCGGGGGAYGKGLFSVFPGDPLPVSVGRGGFAGTPNGGSSSFSNQLVANGGTRFVLTAASQSDQTPECINTSIGNNNLPNRVTPAVSDGILNIQGGVPPPVIVGNNAHGDESRGGDGAVGGKGGYQLGGTIVGGSVGGNANIEQIALPTVPGGGGAFNQDGAHGRVVISW